MSKIRDNFLDSVKKQNPEMSEADLKAVFEKEKPYVWPGDNEKVRRSAGTSAAAKRDQWLSCIARVCCVGTDHDPHY
jgi:hypothetical protein